MAHARAGLEEAGEVAEFGHGVAQVLEYVVGVDAVEAVECELLRVGDEAGLLLRGSCGFVGEDVPALGAELLHGA